MKNITFPEDWGKKIDKYITLKWYIISDDGNPTKQGVYNVTVKQKGILPFVGFAHFNGTEWEDSVYSKESIVAWLPNPNPLNI